MGRIGVKTSHALRNNSRRTWRHREGSRNVHNTAIRLALSPSHPCGSVTAGVHGCPRGVAPLRHHTASRDILVTTHGRRNDPSASNSSRCEARPPILFSPPGHGLAATRCSSEVNELPRSKLRGIKPPLARSYGPPVWRGNTGSCVHSLEQPQLDVLAIQLRRGFFTALLPDICAHDFFMPMTTYGTNEIPLGPKFATP